MDTTNNLTQAVTKQMLAQIMGLSGMPTGAVTPEIDANLARTQSNMQKAPTTEPVIIPKLKGAMAPQFNGGAGGFGLAAGLGEALRNNYNNKIAQSEAEVKQAEMVAKAAEMAKQSAIEDDRRLQNQLKEIDYKENLPSSQAQIKNIEAQTTARNAQAELYGKRSEHVGHTGNSPGRGAVAQNILSDDKIMAIDQGAKEWVAKHPGTSESDARNSIANQNALNMGLKGYQATAYVAAVHKRFKDEKAADKTLDMAHTEAVKDAHYYRNKMDDPNLYDEEKRAEYKAAFDKSSNMALMTSREYRNADKAAKQNANSQNVNTQQTMTPPTGGQSVTQPANPAKNAIQQPQEPTIQFTGETDPVMGRRIIDANGRKGWMK